MKLISILLCLTFLFSSACAEGNTLKIIATNFPCYDLARSVAGEKAQLQLLLRPGSESHSFEPAPQDIISIQNCDLFIYTGGESDTWIESILASLGDNAPRSFVLSEHVELLASEASESMEDHHHHEHAEECLDPDHRDSAIHAHDMDEHVWTSPVNMISLTSALADALCEIDSVNASYYQNASLDYKARLTELDQAIRDIVSTGKRDLLIFGDRFPFRYFAAEYGLQYDAAFPGCSEDSEPSVRTVISLIDTVRAEQIPVVFHIEFSSKRTVEILAEETGATPLLFHSCHNVSADELEQGVTYLKLMWQNTEALKEALN